MFYTKNSTKMTKFNKLLIALTAFLAILYFLSFTKSCTTSDHREKIKSALVNQKYKDSITSFELSDASLSILIKKQGSFWTITAASTPEISLPASSERIEKLTENLIKVRNLYKISDKINKNSSFGLTNGTEFHLRYNTADGTFHELIFGNQDFSLSSRYIMTEKSTAVYEIDSSLDNFLTTSIQSWTEPFIISQSVLGKIQAQDIQRSTANYQNHLYPLKDCQKLLELRHGGLPGLQEVNKIKENQKSAEIKILLESGNKDEIELEIYPADSESEYIIQTQYYKASAQQSANRQPFYTSYSKISSWTYNKIKENIL